MLRAHAHRVEHARDLAEASGHAGDNFTRRPGTDLDEIDEEASGRTTDGGK